MITTIVSQNELVEEIAEALRNCDGKYVESIANDVLLAKITYNDDSMFTREDTI